MYSRRKGPNPLLGAVTLEIFGLEVGPVNRRLIRVDGFVLEMAGNLHRKDRMFDSDETAGPTPLAAKLQRIPGHPAR